MKILIVGSGGREDVLAWKIAKSKRCDELFCAPGNAGTSRYATNVAIAAEDIEKLRDFAKANDIGLTVVGPEDSLCGGIVDAFQREGLRIFGPTADAARLEGDKAYAKQLMRQAAIPTADGRIFENYTQARNYIASRDIGLVVKAAGLAKGKGAIVCDEPSLALRALENIMVKRIFGEAGAKVVVEEKLAGPEVSIQALVDGRTIYVLESAQDHKAVGDGDVGPNTGGMGAYCPADVLDDKMFSQVYREVLVPVVDAMNRQGITYRGVLYIGLMLTPGGPKVLEFNCRFGDPEAQVVLTRLQNDLVDVFEAVIDGRLEEVDLCWDSRSTVCVVMAAPGYPDAYAKGKVIHGLDRASEIPDVMVFHGGTEHRGAEIVTNGGRVLGVTAWGDDIRAARDRAYQVAELISFDGGALYRRDIAHQAIENC